MYTLNAQQRNRPISPRPELPQLAENIGRTHAKGLVRVAEAKCAVGAMQLCVRLLQQQHPQLVVVALRGAR